MVFLFLGYCVSNALLFSSFNKGGNFRVYTNVLYEICTCVALMSTFFNMMRVLCSYQIQRQKLARSES